MMEVVGFKMIHKRSDRFSRTFIFSFLQVNFSLNYHGQQLIQDTDLSLAMGNRYGLIGLNGSGKSSMLTALGRRLVEIPEHISMFHVDQEAQPSDETALETVLQDLQGEVAKLEGEYEELCDTDPDSERCQEICDRLDELDPELAPARAGKILFGLGFDKDMQNTRCKEFSGGWRMRVALARALFVAPDLLIIEDPTSHLDLGAVVWLEEYLKNYPRMLLITSHSQVGRRVCVLFSFAFIEQKQKKKDFMNGVCTNIILLRQNKLHYYKGNYDTYCRTRAEQEENQMKIYKKEQDEIADIKQFVARFGHGTAKMVRQAQSREKVLKKMEEVGLTQPVESDRTSKVRKRRQRDWNLCLKVFVQVIFYDPAPLSPPVISLTQVSFGYSQDKMLYRRVDFGVDLDSRISIVGPNGAGKVRFKDICILNKRIVFLLCTKTIVFVVNKRLFVCLIVKSCFQACFSLLTWFLVNFAEAYFGRTDSFRRHRAAPLAFGDWSLSSALV
jgi:ATP-binding cassette subfamily F protein 2